MGPHTTADDPTRYRSPAEENAWRAKDPLSRLATLLRAEGLADEVFERDVEAEADDAAARLRRGCLALADPEPLDAFAHVYAGPHPWLDEERAAYAAYLAGFDDEDGRVDDRGRGGAVT
jgi:pyruvate dehydrogenase E1 component alpha subunit